MNGNFRFDDPNYFGTWLAEDMNISLYHTSTMYIDDGDHFGGGFDIYWNASVSIVGQINSLRLSNIYMYSENTGSMCEIEPSGTIAFATTMGTGTRPSSTGPSTTTRVHSHRTVTAAERCTGAANCLAMSVLTLACL